MKPWRQVLTLLAGVVLLSHAHGSSGDALTVAHEERMQKLVEALDPLHPDMGPAIEAWHRGNQTDAMDAISSYFRQKAFDRGLLESIPPVNNKLRQAEAALENTFQILDAWHTVPLTGAGGLDWTYRGDKGDKEVAWMLNRHAVFPLLGEVWEEKGDERLADRMNQLWQDWILNSPYPGRLTFSPQWRALEVARRINNSWVHSFYPGKALTDETRLLVLSSIPDHADALRNHASFWGGNHLISEKLALLTIAIAWPEFKDAAGWKDHAIRAVSDEIMRQTYPDGSYMELSNHYQRVVLLNGNHFLRLLATIDPEFRNRPVYERIVRMWEFFAGVMKPDGTGPLNNASDREYNASLVKEAWAFHDRPDWLAIATNGKEGRLPGGSASRFFPWAGQAVIRNHWGPRADWIYFDAGPYGTAHQHEDRLHISASLDGRPLLTDAGRYTYQPGPWRDYFKGPRSHSLISLDGRTAERAPRQARVPLPVVFQEMEEAVFTAARTRFHFDGALPSTQAPVPWTRAVLYDRRGFAIVLDHLVTFQRHELEARWHFHPDVTDEESARALRLAEPREALGPTLSRGSGTPPLGGFHSTDYNRKEAAAMTAYRGSIDKPTTLFWVISHPEDPVIEIQILNEKASPEQEFRVVRDGQIIAEAAVRLHPEPALKSYSASGN
jgi:hypothetical protein